MKLKTSRSNAGFTLIEVLVGIVIISAAAVTMYYGVLIARGQIRQVVLKERALEELSNYMDYWMARINDGNISNHELSGDAQGELITLYYPSENIVLGQPTDYVEATIYRLPIKKRYSEYNPQFQPYYELEAYIVWNDYTTGKDDVLDSLRFKTAAFVF